ncbi:unnamed protein product [Arctia plantaginis]|uniref:Uncharacterized protein n=1 Tax=Arctia plantaginis TaxID=874455 RepID=A0A8S0Z379_ARCPL|nr:unnamed protein product [Arctia plantaginis]
MVPSITAEVYRCYDFEDTSVKIIIFSTSAMYVFSIGVCIYFIYGLCSKKSDHPTMVMMFMILKAMILTIITAILVFFETPKAKICPDGFVLGTSTTLNLFIQGYSLLIVNSFRLEEGIGVYDDDE